MKKVILLTLLIFIAFFAIAYSTTLLLGEVSQLGASNKIHVNKYNIRLISASLTVSGNVFYNRITGITITISSSIPGNYNIYARVTSGSCSATATWNNVDLSTQRTLSSSLTPQCSYTPPGAAVEVGGEPV